MVGYRAAWKYDTQRKKLGEEMEFKFLQSETKVKINNKMLMLLLPAKFLFRQPKLKQIEKQKLMFNSSVGFLPNQCYGQCYFVNL